jgi:hypothetical protein
VEADNPPKHLVLGAIALDGIRNKLKETLAEVELGPKRAVGPITRERALKRGLYRSPDGI